MFNRSRSFNDVVDAVPKLYPVLHCVDCSLEDHLVFWVLSRGQFVHQLLGKRTVLLAVDLDVALQVKLQEFAAVVFGKGVHEPLEHLGNRVLATIEKLRGNIRNGLVEAADGVGYEMLDVAGDFGLVECVVNCGSFPKGLDVVLNDAGVGLDFFHGLDVQLEVRSMAVSIRMHISFLSQDDLIDKPSSAP